MTNLNKYEFEEKETFRRIIKSIIFSIVLTLILLFIYAILLSYTNIPEGTMKIVIISISSISILIFSILCMLKIKNNGIIYGGIIGLGYMMILYLVSSVVQVGFKLDLYATIMILGGVLCGMLGGIIGVNIK